MKRLPQYILTTISALALSACTQANFSIVNAPAYFDGVKRVSSVAYGDDAMQTLDIYKPSGFENEQLPVVFFIHGGRWTDGRKDQYKFVGSRIAREGYVVVIPDYRKYPDVKFPEMIEDPAVAVDWVFDHINEYDGNANVVHVMGHSSGAHVGALITADERYLKKHGKSNKRITSFVGLAGPYHFTPDEADLIDMFGPAERFSEMQLGTFIDAGDAPMMMLWGERDVLVGMVNIDNTIASAKAKGFEPRITVKTYDNLDHIGIVSAFTWLFEKKTSVLQDVMTFLDGAEKP